MLYYSRTLVVSLFNQEAIVLNHGSGFGFGRVIVLCQELEC